MRVTYLSDPTPPGPANDDFVLASNRFVVVLDGATAPAQVETGCMHDVEWFAGQLGTWLGRILTTQREIALARVLSAAIQATCDAHSGTCDLSNPDSPSATVTILRDRPGEDVVDYLVLSDSTLLLESHDGGITAITDDRTQHLPDYAPAAVRRLRNSPGGFWVAGTRPEAAEHAITGTRPRSGVRRAALLSDGAARLVERYGRTWRELLDIAEHEGLEALLRLTRDEEARTPEGRFRGKRFDDSTAAFCHFGA